MRRDREGSQASIRQDGSTRKTLETRHQRRGKGLRLTNLKKSSSLMPGWRKRGVYPDPESKLQDILPLNSDALDSVKPPRTDHHPSEHPDVPRRCARRSLPYEELSEAGYRPLSAASKTINKYSSGCRHQNMHSVTPC